MPDQTPTYDLMLLLSALAEEDVRAKILADVEAAISNGGGSIVHNGDWGIRPMTYRIQHQQDAEYHLLQFTGPPTLIEALNHSLGITDGVLRHRIIKVLPGTPPPPTPTPVHPSATAASSGGSAPGARASGPDSSDEIAASAAQPTPGAAATATAEESEAEAVVEPAEAPPEDAEAETGADEQPTATAEEQPTPTADE